MRKILVLISIFILAILPILRWFMLPGLPYRFIDINTMSTSLGQIAGLLGISFMSISLILSGRFKFLDRLFSGINISYNHHRVIGTIAFSLLLSHPLLLAVKYLTRSAHEAALFLLTQDPAVVWGKIALALMMILIIATFYIRLKYQRWKFSHKFMTAVIVFALLHASFITSDVSRDLWLRTYILGMAGVGLIVGSYRAFLFNYFGPVTVYKTLMVKNLNDSVVMIDLEPLGKKISYQPGQFVFVSFKSEAVAPESHPFSITSTPQDNNLQLVIKNLGDFTAELKKLKPGDIAGIEGPFGAFSYLHIQNKKQVWIAGGVGITPFISMARSLNDPGYKIDLYYSARDEAEAVLLDELMDISKINNNLRIIPWFSSAKGFINTEAIAKNSPDFKNRDFMLCGPPVFMESLRAQLTAAGISNKKIHWEKFSFI